MKKKSLWLFSILFLSLSCFYFSSCEGGDDDGDGNEPQKENPTTPNDGGGSQEPAFDPVKQLGIKTMIMGTSPDEPLIYRIENDKGEFFILNARKDAEGNLLSQESLTVVLSGDNPDVTQIQFDEKNRPVDIIAPNGVRILYEWLSDTEAAITIMDPETDEQLNTVYDFKNGGEVASAPKSNTAFKTREGDAVLTGKTLPTSYNQPTTAHRAQTASKTRKGSIYLKECDVDKDGDMCWVDVYDWEPLEGYKKSGYRDRYYAKGLGNGKYQYELPKIENAPLVVDFLQKWGPTMKKWADGLCLPNLSGSEELAVISPASVTVFCAYLSAKAATVTGPFAIKIGAACVALGTAVIAYCNTIGKGFFEDPDGPGVSEVPDALIKIFNKQWEGLWDKFIGNVDYTQPIVVIPTVNALPKPIRYTPFKVENDLNVELPAVEISIGMEPSIQKFTLNPPAPAHRVSYDAIATLSCLPAGSVCVMTVVGTDGYTKTETKTLEKNVINYELTLHVPGAETGVKDLCTVAVQLPDGKLLQKQASLVFQ